MKNDFELLCKTVSDIVQDMTLKNENSREYTLIGGRTDSQDNVVQSLLKVTVEIKDIYKYEVE